MYLKKNHELVNIAQNYEKKKKLNGQCTAYRERLISTSSKDTGFHHDCQALV